MAKEPASTSLEEELLERIKLVAQIEGKSIAEILALCIELGIPHLEEEFQNRAKQLAEVFERGRNPETVSALPPKPEQIESYRKDTRKSHRKK